MPDSPDLSDRALPRPPESRTAESELRNPAVAPRQFRIPKEEGTAYDGGMSERKDMGMNRIDGAATGTTAPDVTTGIAEPALPRRLEPGGTAPDFTLRAICPADGAPDAGDPAAADAPSFEERDVNLAAELARGRRVVLYFYPAAMTPGCTVEACDFRDSLDRLAAAGVTVLGVSKDPLARLRRFAERDHLTFPLLSDPDLAVHRLYGAWGEKKLYGRVHVGVLRSTFVIAPDGRIAIARYNVRAKGHVASLLKALG